MESRDLDGRAALNCSDVTAAGIDEEVMKILKDCYKEAKKLLKENRALMDKLAAHLIEKETITGKEFMEIFRKEKGLPEPEAKEEEKKAETSEKAAATDEKRNAASDETAGEKEEPVVSVDPPEPAKTTEETAAEEQHTSETEADDKPIEEKTEEAKEEESTPSEQDDSNKPKGDGPVGLFSNTRL